MPKPKKKVEEKTTKVKATKPKRACRCRKSEDKRISRETRTARACSESRSSGQKPLTSYIDGSSETSVDTTVTETEGIFPSEENLLDVGCEGIVESLGGTPSPDTSPYSPGPGIGGFGDPNVGTPFF